MADNYIEKKMEDLRSGAATRHTSRRSAIGPSAAGALPGALTLHFPEMRIFVAGDATTPLGVAIIRAMREVGCKVAFSGADADRGKAMAQELGAQFHPLSAPGEGSDINVVVLPPSVAYTVRHWRGIDALIVLGGTVSDVEIFGIPCLQKVICIGAPIEPSADVVSIPLSSCSPSELAACCRLLLSAPLSLLPRRLHLSLAGVQNVFNGASNSPEAGEF